MPENIQGNIIAYLGPQGTHSYEAALALFPHESRGKIACADFHEIFRKVAGGEADCGVVPAENSTEGTVRATLDLLVESSVRCIGSFEMPIHQQLLSREKKLSDIKTVISHPQALAQCKQWLIRSLPTAKLVASQSTTAGLSKPLKGAAYIASASAAKLHAVPILQENIEDAPNNTTLFYVIAKKPARLAGVRTSRTLLFVTIYNRVGILRDMLGIFADLGLNLVRLESRPSREKLWDYYFFMELDSKYNDPAMVKALKQLGAYCPVVKILGQT